MNDVEFIFLMFFMVVGGTCSIALCIQILQCCLVRFCEKKEKINVLQIRAVTAMTNPIVVPISKNETSDNPIIILLEEDPKN